MRFIIQHCFSYLMIILVITTAVLLGANFYTAVAVVETVGSNPVTVVIDAGHGGEDGGAVSADGVRESVINLQIALRLNDLFHLLGTETKMTRTEDVSLHSDDHATIAAKKVSDLKNRVELVNGVPNPLLVSIHQNMFEESKYHGMQVFYAPTGGSQSLAETIQSITAIDPTNRRVAKPAESIYLMQNIFCTGVLVECGFLSNPEECAKLCTDGYQKQMSLTVAAGVTDYLRKVSTNEV